MARAYFAQSRAFVRKYGRPLSIESFTLRFDYTAQSSRPEITKDSTMVRKLILALALGGIALTATACNTVKGVGRDIESVGNAADRAM